MHEEGTAVKIQNIITAVLSAILKVVIAIALVTFIYRAAMLSYDFGYRILTEPAMSVGEGRSVSVTVTSDMSALEIGKMMEEKGLSRDGRLFALQYLFSEYREDIKPGTYDVRTSMTAEEIMAAMVPTEKEVEPADEMLMDTMPVDPTFIDESELDESELGGTEADGE